MPDKKSIVASPEPPSNITVFPPTERPKLAPADVIGVRLDVNTLLTRPTREIQWMAEDTFPEKAISIVSGMAYIGKSYIGMEIGIAFSSGRDLFGKFKVHRPYRVGYFDLEMMIEDTERRFARMLKREPAGTDWSNLNIMAQSALRIDDGGGSMAKLKANIKSMGLEVVIIDSLRRMHLGDDKESKQSDAIFTALKQLRDELGCASIMLAHWRKANMDGAMNNPAERLSGSADYRNFVDVHFAAVKHHAKDHLTIFPDKTRQSDGAPAKYVLKFDHIDRNDKNGPFSLIYAEDPPEDSSIDKLMAALIANQPCTISDLAKAAQMKPKTVERIVLKWRKTGECNATGTYPMLLSTGTI